MARKFNGFGMLAQIPEFQTANRSPVSLFTYLLSNLRTVVTKLNGALSFGNGEAGAQTGNIDGVMVDVFFPAAATVVVVTHDLGRVPIGAWPLLLNAGGAVITHANQGSWTDRNAQLVCSVAQVTARIIFV